MDAGFGDGVEIWRCGGELGIRSTHGRSGPGGASKEVGEAIAAVQAGCSGRPSFVWESSAHGPPCCEGLGFEKRLPGSTKGCGSVIIEASL